MKVRRSEVIVLAGAVVAIAVVILVTLYVLDRLAEPGAQGVDVDRPHPIGIPTTPIRESGNPPPPDRGSHPVPSPG